MKTLHDVDPEAFAIYMALSDKAYSIISAPDYVPVLPPPENKIPANLIYTWGVEMLRIGFELALEFLEGESKNENKVN